MGEWSMVTVGEASIKSPKHSVWRASGGVVNTSGVGRAKHPGCTRTDPPSPHPLYCRGLWHILHFIINQTRRCFPGFQELLSQTLKAEENVGTPSREPRRTEAGGSPGTPYLQLLCGAVSGDGALDRWDLSPGRGGQDRVKLWDSPLLSRRMALCVCGAGSPGGRVAGSAGRGEWLGQSPEETPVRGHSRGCT